MTDIQLAFTGSLQLYLAMIATGFTIACIWKAFMILFY